MTKQEYFERLQARWRAADVALSEHSASLRYRYGNTWQAKPAERKRLDALRDREGHAVDAIMAWLDNHSPRDWRRGVPCHYVCGALTYADAVTSGPLSVVPPVAFGCYQSDAVRFAQPVA